MKNLNIGMHSGNITPPANVKLSGQFYTRVSTHVECPLSANVIAINSEGEQLVICSCDLTSIDETLTTRVREAVHRQRAEIDTRKIILSATHTHTAPMYVSRQFGLDVANSFMPSGKKHIELEDIPEGTWSEEKCFNFLVDTITSAIIQAWDNRKPACISQSFGRAVTGHCRRAVYNDKSALMYGSTHTVNFDCLEGGSDTGVELLYIFDTNKTPMGVLVNTSCPSQVEEHCRYISSDYWGRVRETIHDTLGNEFVVVGLCSAAGDQSPRDLIRNKYKTEQAIYLDPNMHEKEGAIELGRRISSVIIDKIQSAKENIFDNSELIHEVRMVDFPLRRVESKEYLTMKEAFYQYVEEKIKDTYTWQDYQRLHLYAGTLKRYQDQENTMFYTAEIHVIRLGNVAITSNPFELFLDYGNRIRANSKAQQTFMIQLACASGGYLPTEKAEKGGHYSAYVASGKTGHEGGELLVRYILEMINAMWP